MYEETLKVLIECLKETYEQPRRNSWVAWLDEARARGIPDNEAVTALVEIRVDVEEWGNGVIRFTDAGYQRRVLGRDRTIGVPADVASIRYPQQFHELCRDLLHAEFSRVQTYEGSGGDAGVDGYDPDTETILQFHGPEFAIRKEKLKSYLDKASRQPARRWVLLSKRDLTPKQSAWLDSVRSQYRFAIEVWGPARLNQLLDKHPQVGRRYSVLPAAREAPSISVGAQQAAQIVNVVGPTTINTSRRGIRTLPIPGTVGSDPFKKGELAKLVDRLAEFRSYDIGKDKMRSIYGAIHKSYLREKGCRVNDTPLERFEEAVSYFRRKIDNTKLGRINRGKGYPNY